MQFTISPEILKNELSFLASVTDRDESTIASNVLIQSQGVGEIEIKGTNMSVSVKSTVDASVKKEGSICINGRKLYNIIKVLSDDIVFTKEKNDWVTLKSGNSKFRLAAFNEERFPEISVLEKSLASIDATALSKMVKATAFAITEEESRYALSGVKFTINDSMAKMVSTDGFRVSVMEKDATGKISCLIPKQGLAELAKLPKGKVVVGESENQLFFSANKRYVTLRKLAGDFPNYEAMFKFDGFKEIEIKKEELKDTLIRVSLMSDQRNKSVKFSFTKGALFLSTATDKGESEGKLEIDYEGKDVEIALNSKFLLDFLSNCEYDIINVYFKNSSSPVLLGKDDDRYKYCVMPLRI